MRLHCTSATLVIVLSKGSKPGFPFSLSQSLPYCLLSLFISISLFFSISVFSVSVSPPLDSASERGSPQLSCWVPRAVRIREPKGLMLSRASCSGCEETLVVLSCTAVFAVANRSPTDRTADLNTSHRTVSAHHTHTHIILVTYSRVTTTSKPIFLSQRLDLQYDLTRCYYLIASN